MSSLGWAIGLGVLCGMSMHAGQHWARSTLQAALFGVAAAFAAVTAAAVTSVFAFAYDPSSVDLGEVGIKLIALMTAGPVMGAVLTIGTRRRALRRLPRPPLMKPPTKRASLGAKHVLFGVIWFVSLAVLGTFGGGMAAGMTAPRLQGTSFWDSSGSGKEAGLKAARDFGANYGGFVILGVLVLSVAGTLGGVLPGTRRRSTPGGDVA